MTLELDTAAAPRVVGRVACSGRARSVLDHIDRVWDEQEPRRRRTVQLPFSPQHWGLLELPEPMREDEWEQMLRVIEAMKFGFVVPR